MLSGRLSRERRSPTAEVSLVVADQWQHRGIGQLLLEYLIKIGRQEWIQRLTATMLVDNNTMVDLCNASGFSVCGRRPEEQIVHMERSIALEELDSSECVVL